MKRKQFYLLILLGCLTFGLKAQEDDPKKEEKTQATDLKDETRKGMFNNTRSSVNGALAAGGAFYVSNPSPTYEVDVEKAYYDPEWQDGEVRMVNGDFYKAKLRYRIIDQAFEVLHEGEAYELKQNQLQGIYLGGTRFILMPDPLLKKRGVHIYELHYNTNNYQLVEHHGAQWQDPPEQNMFDTREQHKTIKSMKELIFRTPAGFEVLNGPKDLLRILGFDKKSTQARYAKRNNLKLNQAADIIAFLEYLEGEGGR